MQIGIDATPLPFQPVGAGNYIIHLIEQLAKINSQHEFVIFAQRHGCQLINIPPRAGFRWVVVPDVSPARRLLWEQISLPGLVRRERVDLLHSLHYTRPLSLSCASVVTFHDMTFFLYPDLHTLPKRLFFPPAIRYSARKSDALIAVSENTRTDSIRLLKIPPQKIHTTPLGVDSDYRPISDAGVLADTRQKHHLPEQFLLYVGTVEPRKNLSLLINSYAYLVNHGVSSPLVVVGRFGWMYREVLRQVEVLGLKDRVIFLGYVPHQDLPGIYNLAEIFVYPSLYEGFGMPSLEAMACGTPVITTNVSAMPEFVGDAGILVPPNNEQALIQAIQEVLDSQELRERLRTEGPRRAAAFTWERTAQETLKVYQLL